MNPRDGDSAGPGHSCALGTAAAARPRWWSGEQGLSALKGTRRAPGRDGNEPPGVRAAQRRPLGWAETFPAPRHNVCKYQRPLMAGPPAGRARGLQASPSAWGLLELRSAPRMPHGTPDGGASWAGAARCLCRCLGAGARGAGSVGEECSRSMPTMLGLTALKSGCHIPSGQPFTSICGGLFGSRLIQPTQTSLNPLAPAGPGRGPPAPSGELGIRMCCCHPAATSEGMM